MVCVPTRDRSTQVRPQRLVPGEGRQIELFTAERAAAGGAGPGQDAESRSVVTCDHDIVQRRGAGGEQFGAELSDVDPGAGAELEVFRDAPVEEQPGAGVVWIREGDGVADAVVALLVEGRGGELGLVEVALHHVGAGDAHLVQAILFTSGSTGLVRHTPGHAVERRKFVVAGRHAVCSAVTANCWLRRRGSS